MKLLAQARGGFGSGKTGEPMTQEFWKAGNHSERDYKWPGRNVVTFGWVDWFYHVDFLWFVLSSRGKALQCCNAGGAGAALEGAKGTRDADRAKIAFAGIDEADGSEAAGAGGHYHRDRDICTGEVGNAA